MKITIEIQPNTIRQRIVECDVLKDMGIQPESFDKLSHEEKKEWVEKFINDLPEQPFLEVNYFSIKS